MVSGILRGRKNASFDRHIMHPEREWFVVVFIGVGLFGVGIAWNVSTHFQFKNVSISNTPVAEEAVVYRAGLVESALADFEVRKQEYEELKQGLFGNQAEVSAEPEEEPAATEEPVEESSETDSAEVPASEPEEGEVPGEAVLVI